MPTKPPAKPVAAKPVAMPVAMPDEKAVKIYDTGRRFALLPSAFELAAEGLYPGIMQDLLNPEYEATAAGFLGKAYNASSSVQKWMIQNGYKDPESTFVALRDGANEQKLIAGEAAKVVTASGVTPVAYKAFVDKKIKEETEKKKAAGERTIDDLMAEINI